MEIVVLVVVVAVVVAAVVLVIRRREPDTLDSFRRQIDALSPEARRPVVDQVNRLDDTDDGTTEPDVAEPSETDTADSDTDEPGHSHGS